MDGDLAGTRATARATVEPFADSPLKSLSLVARALDLAQVQAGLPTTKLDVEARLAPSGKSFAGPVRIANAAPAPWDRKGLPFTTASAHVMVDPQGRAEISASAARPARRRIGRGQRRHREAGDESRPHARRRGPRRAARRAAEDEGERDPRRGGRFGRAALHRRAQGPALPGGRQGRARGAAARGRDRRPCAPAAARSPRRAAWRSRAAGSSASRAAPSTSIRPRS